MSFLFVLSSKFKLDGRKKTKRNKEAWLPYIHKLNLGSTLQLCHHSFIIMLFQTK